jgi:hypothetical protein
MKGARFKVGQTVFSGRGDKEKKMVVARVIKNPLIPIHQYTFEAPHNGFACGEQSIRAKSDNPDLKLGDCFVDDGSEVPTMINTIASAKRHPIMMDRLEGGLDVGDLFSDSDIFFRPDLKLCEWLKDHANGRLIMDVGCGQGHLVNMLKRVGARAMGIEPNLNKREWLKWRMMSTHPDDYFDVNEVLSYRIEDTFIKKLIENLGKDQVMLVFARPCHSEFVSNGIRNMPDGMEALYITVPENLTKYNDLGRFKKNAVLLKHEGISEDNEVIYSIKR